MCNFKEFLNGHWLTDLKVPSYAFLVITRPLVCYVALSACKRSTNSQTLKVHPVASKSLTQKIRVYAAPERLVGDFSFSIFFFPGHTDVTKSGPIGTPL